MVLNNVLVSVIVVTYNSSSTVLETLNSVKEQNYSNIELIITDDGSLDTTVDICRQWLELNGQYFFNYNLLTVQLNTGLPANCNRGFIVSKGEWIKLIAGDDALKKDCIEINMNYLSINNKIEILQTNADMYLDYFKEANFISTIPNKFEQFFSISGGKQQYEFLRDVGYPLCTPSIIFKRIIVEQVGGFDERFKYIDDVPLWLKLTKANIKIYYHPVSTVNYRSHIKSVARDGKKYMNEKFATESLLLVSTFFKENERSTRIKSITRQLKCVIILDKLGLNNNSFFSKILYYLSTKL